MYNFTDIIRNSFLEEFTEITIGSLLTALLLSFLLSCFIVLIYRLTFKGVLFNGGFALSLILLSMVTTLVILTVSSNVVLSLGMVGALSIVRFRTAVKDPIDTIFMFWAIVTGITTGAGLVPTAVIATLLIGLIFMLVSLVGGKLNAAPYLVIVRYRASAAGAVQDAVKKIAHCRVKSSSSGGQGEELVLEARLDKAARQALESLKTLEGVTEVNLVSYHGSTLL